MTWWVWDLEYPHCLHRQGWWPSTMVVQCTPPLGVLDRFSELQLLELRGFATINRLPPFKTPDFCGIHLSTHKFDFWVVHGTRIPNRKSRILGQSGYISWTYFCCGSDISCFQERLLQQKTWPETACGLLVLRWNHSSPAPQRPRSGMWSMSSNGHSSGSYVQH